MITENIGQVVEGDVGNELIRVHLHLQPNNVFVGMPIIIEDADAIFYCLITNVLYKRDDLTLEMSYHQQTTDAPIAEILEDRNEPDSIETYADLTCLKHIAHNGVHHFRTLPTRLSVAREATMDDINKVYVSNVMANLIAPQIEGENKTVEERKRQAAINFAFGFLASNREIPIPVHMDQLASRPFGVFGQTGSGKTVTTKNICLRIIMDLNQAIKTRLIIFDVNNEYCTTAGSPDRHDLGLYDLIPHKIKIFTVDTDKCERQGIHGAELFRIFRKNIRVEDVIAILSNSDLTEKMISTLLAINQRFYREHRTAIAHGETSNRTFYRYLMDFYNDPDIGRSYDSDGTSYDALHRRLRAFDPDEGYLREYIADPQNPTDRDSIGEILHLLRSSNPDKKSIILHFGRYGNKGYIYEFVANVLVRALFDEYSDKNDTVNEGNVLYYDALMLLIEECHKFVHKNDSKESEPTYINKVAREGRKYKITTGLVDQTPSKLDEEIVGQLNNRIIHRLYDPNDIKTSLSGLDARKWTRMVSNLENGEGLCFGEMVEKMPTLIKSFYGLTRAEWEHFHGIDTVIRQIHHEVPLENSSTFAALRSERPINPTESRPVFKRPSLGSALIASRKDTISPPSIPKDTNEPDDE